MQLQYYVEKLEQSEQYKKFMQEHPKAYLFAGFFVLDLQIQREEQKLDFFDPESNTPFSFNLIKEFEIKSSPIADQTIPQEIPHESEMNITEIQGILEEKMVQEKTAGKLTKIIAVMQKHEGEIIWNVNSVLSTFDILKVYIVDKTKEITKFEVKGLMDFVKAVKK
jgi:hypothetical protein